MAEPLVMEWIAGRFAVCRLAASADVPAWASGATELVSITRSDAELSIVVSEDNVPDEVTAERGWVAMRVAGKLAFPIVGVLAKLTGALADAGVSVFAFSTYDTDYLMVKATDAERAVAALQRVGDEMDQVHPVLAEELKLVTLESQMGIPRSESLDNFATRTGIDEARSLVGVVNQAERFGTSIARALRRQSDALRVKRRQAAEEKAQQTTVKLMLPLILFIFPAIFVVLGGPAALTMMEALKTSNLG